MAPRSFGDACELKSSGPPERLPQEPSSQEVGHVRSNDSDPRERRPLWPATTEKALLGADCKAGAEDLHSSTYLTVEEDGYVKLLALLPSFDSAQGVAIE